MEPHTHNNITSRSQLRRTEGGFSLLESLLVVAIGAFMLAGVYRVSEDWRVLTENSFVASHMVQVHEAAESYVSANFSDIWGTLGFNENLGDTDGDGVLENSDLARIGAVVPIPIQQMPWSVWYLKDGSGALPPDFRLTNDIDQGVTTFVRNAGIIGGKRAIEVITVTLDEVGAEFPNTSPVDENRLMAIAETIGPQAGYISPVGVAGNVCLNGTIRSMYGNWQVPMSDLSAPVFGWAYCPTLSPVTQGGYLAMYSRVFFEDTFGSDHLYRVAIPGQPELNRMQANLDMNGFSLNNVRYMTADNVRANDGYIRRAIGEPINFVGRGLYVDELLRAEGTHNRIFSVAYPTSDVDRIFDGAGRLIGDNCNFVGGSFPAGLDLNNLATLNPAAVGPCAVAGGQLLVKGKDGDRDAAISVFSILAPEGMLVSGSANVAAGISASGQFTAPELNITDSNGIVGNMVADIVQVTGLVTTNYLELNEYVPQSDTAAEEAAGIRDLSVPAMTSMNDMTVTGTLETGVLNVTATLNVSGTTTVAGNMDVATTADITTVAACRAVIQDDGSGTGVYVNVPEYDCMPDPPAGPP